MDIHQGLRHLGLNKSEISVLLYLLAHGQSSPAQVARGTKIQRTHCYGLLRSLMERGLASEVVAKGSRKAYVARDPSALQTQIEQQKKIVDDLLPDLRNLYRSHDQKPVIRFFEGRKGLEEIYLMSLSAEEVYGIGSTAEMQRNWPDFFTWYQKEIKRRGIIYHDILTHSSLKETVPLIHETLKGLYQVKTLSSEEGESPMDILVWGDDVGLISHVEPYFGTVLTNPAAAQMFRLVFRALWNRMA